MPYLFIILFLLFSGMVRAQAPHPLLVLSEELTARHTTEAEKCRAIFDWITSHIAYDCGSENRILAEPDSAVPPAYYTAQRIENILRTRRTRCEGYALLFKTMCQLSGIYASEVIGYARFDGRTVNDATVLPNHVWNAVRLDGQWCEMDLTAAAGSCINRRFEAHRDAQFWCMRPELLARLYLPITDWRTQIDEARF